ncbi:helix-turn-helix domain-containing protein [Pseudooceanicola sp. MF1-13]|uniref:helix-turn-helix domain-containing protein n=1 Tax=Pseudooceanicola sp. MF1-13 TaxID=3379095 RepID=UPI003891A7F8
MNASQVKSIAALSRGLDVLQLLQGRGPHTLHELHQATNIPKATLLRILKTLRESGMIWQRMADGAYLPSFALAALASRIDHENELVEMTSPVLRQLTDAVKWPSVLAVPRLTHMEVIETNQRESYFDNIPLGPVGFRIPMLRSASGRAFLAFCEVPVRDAILDRLRKSDQKGDRLAQNADYVERLIAETRDRGYALRDADFGGHFDEDRRAVDDERESIGVPIRLGDHVPGAINITWARRALSRAQGVERFAGPLQEAADQISQQLTRR